MKNDSEKPSLYPYLAKLHIHTADVRDETEMEMQVVRYQKDRHSDKNKIRQDARSGSPFASGCKIYWMDGWAEYSGEVRGPG
jgi:hypothetical protein